MGITLNRFARQLKLQIIAPDHPTRYSKKSDSIIDFALARNLKYSTQIKTLTDLSSDHLPVMLYLNISQLRIDDIYKTIPQWNSFREKLIISTTYPGEINSPDAVEAETNSFTEDIIKSFHQTAKLIKIQNYETPKHIKEQTTLRNRLRKEWQRSKSPLDKKAFNRAQNKLSKMWGEHNNSIWNYRIEHASAQDGTTWQLTRMYTRNKFKIPPLWGVNTIAYSNEEKAEELAFNLEDQFTIHNIQDSKTDKIVNNDVKKLLRQTPKIDIEPCTPEEVTEAIKLTKKKKSPGKDAITNEMLQNLPIKMICRITKLINAILKLQYFPKPWRSAIIVPIHKPGKDPHNPTIYRPISLLSSLSKVAEKIILNRLKPTIKNKLIPYQFGFKRNHSTIAQLLRMTEIIRHGWSEGKDTGAVFLDVAKAFDKVWPNGLIYKLMKMGVPDSLTRLIASYLKNRSFQVRVGEALSKPIPIHAGVAQGSILAPFCFNVYVNDITRSKRTQLYLFADDTAILSTSSDPNIIATDLQTHLDELEKWLIKWKMKVNVEKSQAVYFSNKLKKPPAPSLNRQTIPWQSQTKYLCIILDQRLTYKHHFDSIIKKFKAAKAQLYPLLGRNSKLSMDNKLLIYKSFLRPVITYAAPISGAAAPSHINRLECLQNILLRQISKMPWFVRNNNILKDLAISSLTEFIKKLAISFFKRIDLMDNMSIRSIPKYNPANPANTGRPRKIIL
ncbi:putative RNA-directed DNA polymerase from transposon X-element [Araneus ventricosus]|uniref:Putative RNA-directed DNA polymerase from transposon X-element n=1 Tax=Araneus ventricosus TaxID=182803 RepID=A0A4Y2W626_ARAVE|nr:putative RNA-directed DNA polymerase from transposon X-element [Araneus ventricosus]